MRISDWSSDVCSSDLHRFAAVPLPVPGRNLMSAICRDATFLGANPFAHYIRPMTNFRLHQPGIVGAGRVAQALALALRPHAIAPPMLWGRSPEKARSAAAGVGAVMEPDLDRLIARCDLIIIAVADDALADVVSRMAVTLQIGRAH